MNDDHGCDEGFGRGEPAKAPISNSADTTMLVRLRSSTPISRPGTTTAGASLGPVQDVADPFNVVVSMTVETKLMVPIRAIWCESNQFPMA